MSSGPHYVKSLQWACRAGYRPQTIGPLVHRPFTTSLNASADQDTAEASPPPPRQATKYPAPAPRRSSRFAEERKALLQGISRPQKVQLELMEDLKSHAQEADKRSTNPIARRQEGLLSGMMRGERPPEKQRYEDVRNIARPTPLAVVDAPLRLDAFVGRSEAVDVKGASLATALKRMEIKCAVNRIRTDVQTQKYHERPGLRRKRLKRERHRKRFKEGFVATVAKVQRMRKQGW